MRAEITTMNFHLHKEIASFSNNVHEKKIHLACPAITGDSMAMRMLEKVFGVHQAASFVEKVNVKKEAGCFYPRLTVTIYPILEKGGDEEAMMEKIMNDIIEANEKHFKTETLHVIMEQAAGYDPEAFLKCLNKKLDKPAGKFEFLKYVQFTAIPPIK